jgi:predicted nucleotidyltransferase
MNADAWQSSAIEQLCEVLTAEPGVSQIVLYGSLADEKIQPDYWSDVDLGVLASTNACSRLFNDLSWLSGIGTIVGYQRNDWKDGKTLRISFDGMKRYDVLLLHSRKQVAEKEPNRLLWSRSDAITETHIVESPEVFQRDASRDDAEAFWFVASWAVAKVMRKDLLIGLHLALGLARSCLELQMVLRDQKLGRTIHRIGGFGNDVAARLCTGATAYSPLEIVNIIARSCEVYDELASSLWSWYQTRLQFLEAGFRRAQDELEHENG